MYKRQAICCVLPFRLMTSCLHIMSRCTLQKERALKVTLQVALEAAAGAESAVYDCLVIRLHASYKIIQNMRMRPIVMGLLQLRYEHDSSTIRLRFERDTTSYEELCAFEQ